MAKFRYFPEEERGRADYGWLKPRYSFSFSNWYNPSLQHFGKLRVLNDDIVMGGGGFPTHPHANMEIITVPLKGAIAHKDSTGGEGLITMGEVQVMSAGSGLVHSEFNGSETEELNLLQLWIFPKEMNINPRYDQLRYDVNKLQNNILNIVSPNKEEGTLWINQDAWISLAKVEKDTSIDYTIKNENNGVFTFIIEGSGKIAEQDLKKRDALGVSQTDKFSYTAKEDSFIIFIDVPMN